MRHEPSRVATGFTPTRRFEGIGSDEGQVPRDRCWSTSQRVALKPTLKEVEVGPITGKLNVHRSPQLGAEDLEQGRHLRDERSIGHQTLKSDYCLLLPEIDGQSGGPSEMVLLHDGYDPFY